MIFGVIEGFYGRPWTQEQRFRLLEQLKRTQLNTYIYSPKDDRKHRAAWRELYNEEEELLILQQLINRCNELQLNFMYGIGPGLDINYSKKEDLQKLVEKLEQIQKLGCSNFALLFDDIDIEKDLNDEDQKKFGKSYAKAQSFVANEVYEKISKNKKIENFVFCPTHYCGDMGINSKGEFSTYLLELGTSLKEEISFFWTGPNIISLKLDLKSLKEIEKVMKRKPIIWDNIFANDYDMRRIYLAPFDREINIKEAVNGIILNPNCEFEANFIPVESLGHFNQSLLTNTGFLIEQSLKKSITNWHPFFKNSFSSNIKNQISLEDVELLVHLFYLPDRHGPLIENWIQNLKNLFLKKNSPDWDQKYESVILICKKIISLYKKVTEIDQRELCYTFYSYLWDIKEESIVIIEILEKFKKNNKNSFLFASEILKPKVNRGGIVSEIQKIFPLNEKGIITFSLNQNNAFILRNAKQTDIKMIYKVCLETGDHGNDGTHLYDYPEALGDRYSIPYLGYEPDFAFVLEDDEGVCGYTFGCLDTENFYEKFKEEWVPKMKKKYPNVPEKKKDKNDNWIINELHSPTLLFPPTFSSYPSHLHIDLLPRAQGKGLGQKVLKNLFLKLKERNSKGIHLCLSSQNDRALKFYEKLGFYLLQKDEEDTYLGMKF